MSCLVPYVSMIPCQGGERIHDVCVLSIAGMETSDWNRHSILFVASCLVRLLYIFMRTFTRTDSSH